MTPKKSKLSKRRAKEVEENKEIEIEISQNGGVNDLDNSTDRRVTLKPEMNNHLDLDSPI